MSATKRNLIVFDIDGTLTDTVAIHQHAFKKALTLIGITEFNDRFGSYKHHTDSHIAKVIYELATSTLFDTAVSEQFEDALYNLICQQDIKEIAGAKRLVKHIESETDFGVCYATGSMYKAAVHKLQQTGINFNTQQLVASNNIEEREKIVGAAIENAQRYYGVEKFERIISFGDGLWDLLAAQNLSLEFVGIGNVHQELLTQHGMKKHYVDFSEFNLSEL